MEKLETARLIEELGANAWPAPVQQRLGGWLLRAAYGASRRANSVLPLGPVPQHEDWLDVVESFYSRHELPARFQVSDASPSELDDLLASRGYVVEATTLVQAAVCRDEGDNEGPAGSRIVYYRSLDPEWFEAFIQIEGHASQKRRGYKEIMSRIDLPSVFVTVQVDGEPVGIGTAVLERGWAGLFNVATLPGRRRGGIGTQTMRALTAWAARHGAANLYLQVAETNEAALRLYRKLGFSTMYKYHYRSLERK